jgi:hypothetical protein
MLFRFFDELNGICVYEGRFPFFTSFPGMLFFRSSCFTSRMCLRMLLDARLGFIFTVVVLICFAPLVFACAF